VTLFGVESFPPYERPPLSKQLLAGALPVEKTYLRPPGWYAEASIDLRLNTEVLHLDRTSQRLRLSTGETVPYDALLLATGARPRKLPSVRANSQRVYYLRDINDALSLRDKFKSGTRLAIVGAGFIGLEVAATARQGGCTVVVLELASQPLARGVPPEIGAFVADLHRRQGVDLRLNCPVDGIEDTRQCCAIHTGDGSTIEVDIVVVGIGVSPNVSLGKSAGLAVDDGIVVDEFGRTSDPSIFAAGDVTKHFNPLLGRAVRLEAWQNAQNQAIAVAKIMAGGSDAYSEVPWLWTDQYEMNLQVAGMPVHWDQIIYRGDPQTGRFTAFQLADGVLVGALTANSARDMRFARTLIARGKPVERSALADAKINLQELCR
jgi:3-phenylpropionate/trans-cinnamate dioxygenase ferredoxin reductase subunit